MRMIGEEEDDEEGDSNACFKEPQCCYSRITGGMKRTTARRRRRLRCGFSSFSLLPSLSPSEPLDPLDTVELSSSSSVLCLRRPGEYTFVDLIEVEVEGKRLEEEELGRDALRGWARSEGRLWLIVAASAMQRGSVNGEGEGVEQKEESSGNPRSGRTSQRSKRRAAAST